MSEADGQALLDLVWEEPENTERLAVYADWLLEHGDATLGEYIQLALLQKVTPAQEKRQEALRKKHRGRWLGKARPFVYTWQDSEDTPGFVASVKCSVEKLAKGIEHIRVLGPRLVVHVNPVITAAQRKVLAKIPLGRLYGLALYDQDVQWVDDRLVAAIAPKLDGLRRLEIQHLFARLTPDAGWRALIEVPTLWELELHSHDAPDPFLEELVRRPPKHLTHLSVTAPDDKALRRQLAKTFSNTVISFDDEDARAFIRGLR